MEVERLARQDERQKIEKLLCEDCRVGVPKTLMGLHILRSDDIVVPCRADILKG
jgi:hypothetical protein